MITSGTGKHTVELERQRIGEDVLLILRGGEKPHIGSVIVCEPKKETKIVRLGSHKDYIVLEPLAVKACERFNTRVVAVGGIHIEHASKEDIERIIYNCKELESCI